jgi:minor histocompatibility antigen H13
VFGTEVMVTVAKNLDGPIKILFPRDSLERNPVTGKLELSLLGLGDIVIPGFFLALLLRFDAHNAMHGTKIMASSSSSTTANGSTSSSNSKPSAAAVPSQPPHLLLRVHDSFAKPYFHSALVAYVLGLALTMFVMIQFKAAQPALLYLVPACLISSLGCAFVRGEVKQLFAYSEEEEEEEEVEADGEEKKEEAKKVK